jgi:predicted nucleic acid-binding protein
LVGHFCCHTDKEYLLTDAISFTMMTRLHQKTAFAFDKHFGQYGWQIFEPERDK